MPNKGSHFTDVRAVIKSLNPGYPVYCLRPAELERSVKLFLDNFPGRVLYAVKCNPDPHVLQALYDAGIRHFDTASLAEIATVREMFADANACYMHPVKTRASILAARDVYGVGHWVIDHQSELEKLIDVIGAGDGQAVLVRIHTEPFGAAYELSDKFGASAEQAAALLDSVAAAGFQPGLAFHVGSQMRNTESFRHAISTVGQVLGNASTHIHYLDIGGGFPVAYVGEDVPPFMAFMETIRESLATLDLRGDCVVMCEPGRALVGTGCSLLTQVQLRKEDTVYLNDGVFHSMSEQREGFKMPVRTYRLDGRLQQQTTEFRVFGPTCDNNDVLPYTIALPADIDEGDWIEFGQMGAYSNAMASRFNGFFPETFVTVDEAPLLPHMD